VACVEQSSQVDSGSSFQAPETSVGGLIS